MSIRQTLISTIVVAMVPPAALWAANAEYVGGSVKSIPMNAVGSLNCDNAKELRFSYGQGIYKLPYEQIVGTEIAKGETRHVLHKIPVPSLFGRQKQTLTISYKDPSGTSGSLSFELSAWQAKATQNSIAEAKELPLAAAAAASDEWWGDQYWKTTRNKAAWEAAGTAAQNTTAAAASKDPKN